LEGDFVQEALLHRFAFHNDRISPLAEVRLSPGQAGLLNGWGLFSTLRVYDGVPFAFERHWNRLARDADRVQIPLSYSPAAARDAVDRLIAANAVQSGCLRIYFIFNRGTIWHSDEPLPTVDLILCSTDLPARVGPAQLALMPNGRQAANPLSGTKVTAWLNNVWHLEQARRSGFEDTILLNERGEVAECTAANVFCVRGEAVMTPPGSSGCLLGVTREILLEMAPRWGMAIAERAISPDELYSADEVFISSTTRQVQPVARIAEREFGAPGPISQRLARHFSDYVNEYIQRERKRPQR
jgi:branched-chain amino acid aminotransferase